MQMSDTQNPMQNPEFKNRLITLSCGFALDVCLDYIEYVFGKLVFGAECRIGQRETFNHLNGSTKMVGRISLDIVPATYNMSLDWFKSMPEGEQHAIESCTNISLMVKLCMSKIIPQIFKSQLEAAGIPEDALILDMAHNSTMYIRDHADTPVRIGYKIVVENVSDSEIQTATRAYMHQRDLAAASAASVGIEKMDT
jgi:hypothetical protein